MAVPTVLAFNLEVCATALGALCANLGIRFKPIPRESFSTPLGAMAGMPARFPAPSNGENFNAPMLVMCGMEEPTFDAFLKALRASPIPRIPLKAVLTPTNAGWNAFRLYEELSMEHAQMQRMRNGG